MHHFPEILEAVVNSPDGISRLRQQPLVLAMRGALAAQRSDEVPVDEGLRAVHHEKGLTLAPSIRGGESTPRVPRPSECPGELPTGWRWARVDDTGWHVNGLAFKSQDWKPAGSPIIRIQNLTNPAAPFNYAEGPFPEDRMVEDGDILVSWSATLNAFLWDRGTAVVNQHIIKVIPDERAVTAPFLLHQLRYCVRDMAESEAAHGLVMQHVNRGPFLSFGVGSPPNRGAGSNR